MTKQHAKSDQSPARRARQLAEAMIVTLRERFPEAQVRFSTLDTGGAAGLLIIRAAEADLGAIETAADELVAAVAQTEGIRITPRIERPRAERRDRQMAEGFRGGPGGGPNRRGPLGLTGLRLPRKTGV